MTGVFIETLYYKEWQIDIFVQTPLFEVSTSNIKIIDKWW